MSNDNTQNPPSSPSNPSKVVIEFKGLSKDIFAMIWEKMKERSELKGGELILARSMADHPHWFPFFETIGIFDQEIDQEEPSKNPYLHINLHFMIGQQVFNGQPKEAQEYYQTRTQKGDSPHEIIHQMLQAFQKHLIWTAMHHEETQGQFDLQAYANTLKALAPLKKAQIWQRLGFKEVPALHPEANESPF